MNHVKEEQTAETLRIRAGTAGADEIVRGHQDILGQYGKQYLLPNGWFESLEQRRAVDLHGPVPWITYPALRVLERISKPTYRVFEYGAGDSSLWWSQRVAEVVSVEHDERWIAHVRERARPNQRTVHVPMDAEIKPRHKRPIQIGFFDQGLAPAPGPDPGRNCRAGLLSEPFWAYAAVLLDYPPGHFDVIVIDGMARVLTAWLAAQRLHEAGFVLFDNSDRDEYETAYRLLGEAGFRRIDFWGTGPINPGGWCTSIFTKSLDIFS